MINQNDIDEATFKAGYAFASTGLDINSAWIKFSEVQEQLKKNAMKHPHTGEKFYDLPKSQNESDYPLIWEK